ncbi:hypothetical protein [Burkholderia multivorans]|uniref:hypothetical protein n=1 Tax=Burkholderia multivorans TaxID=87883 RepID=UPI001C245E91|nr:hypothetical protein [Burkholderia multivorans]MBU9604755.1 hypothetical protein [Burkholderia multivorans]MBU9622384.1 hypothetical protein [Burkholderia multivorans]
MFALDIRTHHSRLEPECEALGQWFNTDDFWAELDQQLTWNDIKLKETERFVCKLEFNSSMFGDRETAMHIKARGKKFLRFTLPEARRRVALKEEERARLWNWLERR